MIPIRQRLLVFALGSMAFLAASAELKAATINGRVYRASDGSEVEGFTVFTVQVYVSGTDTPVNNSVTYPGGNQFSISVNTQNIRLKFFVGGMVVAVMDNLHGNLAAFTQNIDVVVQSSTALGACAGMSCARLESCQYPCVEATPCETCQPCASPRCGRFLRCRR